MSSHQRWLKQKAERRKEKAESRTLRLSRAQKLLADFAEAEQSQATEGGLKLKAELSSLEVVHVDL